LLLAGSGLPQQSIVTPDHYCTITEPYGRKDFKNEVQRLLEGVGFSLIHVRDQIGHGIEREKGHAKQHDGKTQAQSSHQFSPVL
jgi:hypothetical protein